MGVNKKLTPRDYQIELYKKAVEDNVILYLPTGAGKTFIAIMLIKHMSVDVKKSWGEGKKLTIFLVNTCPLVQQQRDCISQQTDLKCSGYSGDMNVGFWSKDRWIDEFRENHVLVMTPQILLDLLTTSYLSLPRINLIIFDECHHGVKDHPMRQIMKAFEVYDKAKHPKILGLSATLLNCNINTDEATTPVKDLEITFNAKVVTIDSISIQNRYGKPCEECIIYDKPIENIIVPKLREIINSAFEVLRIVDIKKDYLNESSPEFQAKSINLKLKNIFEDVEFHFLQLGIYAGNIGVLHHIIQIERYMHPHDLESRTVYDYVKTSLIRMQKIIYQQMNELTEMQNIMKHSSNKIIKLFSTLKTYFIKMTQKGQKFCCIIFVKRIFTAKILYHLLKRLSELDEDFKFLAIEYVIGSNISNPFKKPVENMSLKKWNFKGLHQFRTGVSNCLIATQVLEEGMDIQQCSLVINFDSPSDFRSYMQSKGRARDENSFFITLIENGDEQFFIRFDKFTNVEKVLNDQIVKNPIDRIGPLLEEIDSSLYCHNIEPYVVRDQYGMISQITELLAIPSLNRYCAKLARSQSLCNQPIYTLHRLPRRYDEAGEIFLVSIRLPSFSPLKNIVYGDPMPSIVLAKRSAAMVACKKLHEIGEFTDRLLPRETHEVMKISHCQNMEL